MGFAPPFFINFDNLFNDANEVKCIKAIRRWYATNKSIQLIRTVNPAFLDDSSHDTTGFEEDQEVLFCGDAYANVYRSIFRFDRDPAGEKIEQHLKAIRTKRKRIEHPDLCTNDGCQRKRSKHRMECWACSHADAPKKKCKLCDDFAYIGNTVCLKHKYQLAKARKAQ